MAYAELILAFPLLGFIIAALLGRSLGKRGVAMVCVSAIGLSFLTVVSVFVNLLGRSPAHRFVDLTLFNWAGLSGHPITFGLLLDPLSVLFMLIITGVGFFIHLYSVGYMADDENFGRYFAYLNLFVLAMLLLIISDNFLFLLVGWGGVGLASYLLIGFWYTRRSAVAAARKAFVVNVVGDVGIMLALFLMYWHFGSVSYASVFQQAATMHGSFAELVAVLLYVGAAAKSAQFPLHVWLPDAMEGPTPVSALIHAATMVTAGVYLVARAYPIFHAAPTAAAWVAGIGAFTALFAATIGVTQYDIKRVLAYSTVSQLGYMFIGVGSGVYAAGLFHFTTHAFFKALLFLGSGSVIHALSGEQDMRKMGGLARKLPITYWTFLMGTLAISGVPGFSGFFSKDMILGSVLNKGEVLIWIAGVLAVGLTAFYMFRLLYMTFFGEYRGDAHPHESPRIMTVPLIVLAVLSVIGGYLAIPGLPDVFSNWLQPVFARYPGGLVPAAVTQPNILSMVLTTVIALSGIYLAYRAYKVGQVSHERARASLGGFYTLVYNKYYIDEIGHALFVRPSMAVGNVIRGVVDGGVQSVWFGLGSLVREWGDSLRMAQSGYVRRYALAILLGVVVIMAYLTFRSQGG